MKLSEELSKWRADRPDEWKMDEFIRNAEKLESESDALSKKLRAAQHEAEALAATVEALREALSEAVAAFNQYELSVDDHPTIKHKLLMQALNDELEAAPQQHLRDVRAEAVSKFIDFMYNSSDCQLCSKSLDVAVKYVKYVSDGEAGE